MRYLSLAGLDLPVSVLGLGTGSPKAFRRATYPRGAALLDAFLAAGGTLIDTAPVYNAGESEETVGRWLRERETRRAVVLVTKGCHPLFDPQDPFAKPWEPRVTPEAVHADLNESLERLQTDYVDVYLLHRDDEQMPVGPLIETLNRELSDGRIRAFGVSNWRSARIAQANAYARQNHLRGFVIGSPSLSLPRPVRMLFPGTVFADEAERAWYAREQFPLLAWSSNAAEFFTQGAAWSAASSSFAAQTYYSADNLKRLRRAQELAAQKHTTALKVGLAFVLNQPFPAMALAGASTIEHLRDSLDALDINLNENERAYLDLTRETMD